MFNAIMGTKEILYSGFYLMFFALSIWAGVKTSFAGDSHTPPIPFGIEFFTLLIGAVLFIGDLRKDKLITFKKNRIHIIGLVINSCVMGYILILAFN